MASTVDNPHKNGSVKPSKSSDKISENNAVPLKSDTVSEWLQALELFDNGKAAQALAIFSDIQPTNSKITYNIASIYATLGNYQQATTHFKKAISFDNYMAISHFQVGVCRFLSGNYKSAANSFNNSLSLLRGNSVVNYQQLGLDYKLYSCEIMYNRALSYIYAGDLETGIYDLGFAVKEKKYITEHSIIDEALTHFTQMQKAQLDPTSVHGNNASSNLEGALKALKLPGALDARNQRFSVLNPPRSFYMNDSDSALELQAALAEPVSPLSSAHPGQMSYSLFSVPQGSLFRLNELKIRSIMNDKKLSSMMMASKSKTYHHQSNSVGPVPSTALPSLPQKSKVQRSASTSAFNHYSGVKEKNNLGVLTPPISPNLSNSSQKSWNTRPSNSTNSSANPSNTFYNQEFTSSSTSIDTQKKDGRSQIMRHNSTSNSSYRNDSREQESALGLYLDEIIEHKQAERNVQIQDQNRSQNYDNVTPYSSTKIGNGYSYSSTRNGSRSEQDGPSTPPKKSGYRAGGSPLDGISSSPTFVNSARSASGSSSPTPGTDNIKVKISCGKETRAMMVNKYIGYTEFKNRVSIKYHQAQVHHPDSGSILEGISNTMTIRLRDEDGDMVLIADQEDLEVALNEAVAAAEAMSAKTGKECRPKIQIFVESSFNGEAF